VPDEVPFVVYILKPMPVSHVIEPAKPSDAAAIRLLLPTVDALLEDPAIFIATLPHPRRVIAAGAVWSVTTRSHPPTVPCALHVAAPWRRQGIGKQLVEVMARNADGWGAKALGSRAPVQRGSPEHQGWQWLGFADSTIMRSYTADIAAALTRHMELYDWCVASGRVPPGARTFRPAPEHAEAIARLNAQGLGGMAWHLLQGYRTAAGTPSDVSMAVADGDRIVGFILTRAISDETLHVHSHVIAPAYRQGWAQAMLHHDFMRWVSGLGYRRFTFEAGEVHTVTRKTAKRIGATLLAERTTMARAIMGSSAEA
jgi:GNAT superfamily N-acetyltransferase